MRHWGARPMSKTPHCPSACPRHGTTLTRMTPDGGALGRSGRAPSSAGALSRGSLYSIIRIHANSFSSFSASWPRRWRLGERAEVSAQSTGGRHNVLTLSVSAGRVRKDICAYTAPKSRRHRVSLFGITNSPPLCLLVLLPPAPKLHCVSLE